jgi:hypothetical protein
MSMKCILIKITFDIDINNNELVECSSFMLLELYYLHFLHFVGWGSKFGAFLDDN